MSFDIRYDLYQHYGTNAERLAFTPNPAPGAQPLYAWYETDTGSTYLYTTSWHPLSIAVPASIRTISIVVDGGGSVITTGVKGFIQIKNSCTIVDWTILSIDSAATSGSIVFDIWKDTYAAYPPTIADTITGSAKPSLSAVNKNTSSTLTGWTTAINAGDVLGFNVDSATSVVKVILELKVSVP